MVLSRMSPMEHIFRRKLIIFIVICLTAATWSASGQTGSDIISLILKGEYQRAQEGLAQIQKTGSESPDTILFLQGLLSTDGEKAKEYYQKLLSTYPNSKYCDDAAFRLAQLAYARGAYKSALSLFRELLTGYPNSNLLPACRQWQTLCMKAMGLSDNEIPETTPQAKEPGLDEILGVIENDSNKKPNITPVTSTPAQVSPVYAVQVNAFAEQNRAVLELKTKTTAIEKLKTLRHNRKKWLLCQSGYQSKR